MCYVGSVKAGDLELVLCGFHKCGRLGTCVMWVPCGNLELVLCGFRKCGRLGTCVMWVPLRETCYVGSVNAGLGTFVMWVP